MVVRYSQKVRNDVTDLIKAGTSDEDIIKQTGISSRTLRCWRRDVQYRGVAGGTLNQKPGRPATIQVHIEEAIRDYLLSRPDASYDEVLWFIFDEFDILISRWTLHRLYESRGWEKDYLRRRALDHAALYRAAWLNTVRDLHTYQVVFVD
ncbi:hypothetical protein GTA08_BOTSDO07070 [Botryosphaeria dothidea]|uniref:Uncharacterized protein n=1 Tax=Botryosphaeria dothidea TaxID=55169 RepID=A0A8H4N0E6_9PEZI|nr:hypothetical protein GTA08_BOTSDO11265 [Botryosphaeria dothidea]KAF4305694.1 hypothetical protein GTA08_BOTSDO07070 [Botryosphaeria dothidea]